MYEPKFSYTDRIVSSLIKVEGLKTSIQDLDLSYNVKHKLQMNSKALDMFHLAHILGLEITLKDAERIAFGSRIEGMDEVKAGLLSNFRNALEFSRSNVADTYAEVDYTILLHLNKLVLTSWQESWNARFRNEKDSLDVRFDDWAQLRDESLTLENMSSYLDEIIEWYRDVSPTMPHLIRYGILIYRLSEIYPFIAANKLTFIAIADYLLLKNGLSSKSYISVVKNFDQNNEKYIEMLNYSRKNYDMTLWLETFITSMIKDLNELKENITEFISDDEKSKKQPFLDLNKRQLKVLRYLQTVPIIKREDYCHMMDVSTMTAFRDLNDLVRKKLLKVDGQGRGTKYKLSSM